MEELPLSLRQPQRYNVSRNEGHKPYRLQEKKGLDRNMRIYADEKETELISVICNCCKKELLVENGILKEEAVEVKHTFGYFGKRDGQRELFDLCEDCYSRIAGGFQIPPQQEEITEFL